jgi:hypothetical protein
MATIVNIRTSTVGTQGGPHFYSPLPRCLDSEVALRLNPPRGFGIVAIEHDPRGSRCLAPRESTRGAWTESLEKS